MENILSVCVVSPMKFMTKSQYFLILKENIIQKKYQPSKTYFVVAKVNLKGYNATELGEG